MKRPVVFAVAAVLLSLSVSLLLLEAFVRVAMHHDVDTAYLRGEAVSASLVPFVRRVADAELLYDLQPGTRVLGWGGMRVEVDPSGCCRVRPGSRADDAAGVRVAVLGDSSAFGWKLPFEDTYGERLRPLLEHALKRTVSLRNYSVPGYNSQQNRIALRDKVLPWHPDLIILHYDHNDADPVADSLAGFLFPEYGDNALHSMLLKLVRRKLRRLALFRTTKIAGEDAARPEKKLGGYRYSGPQFEAHMSEMKVIADLAARQRIPVLVFIWDPWLKRAPNPDNDPFYVLLHKPVADRLSSLGYRVADSYFPYQEYMRAQRRDDLTALWRDAEDAHPSAENHRLIARFLLGEILKMRALPAR